MIQSLAVSNWQLADSKPSAFPCVLCGYRFLKELPRRNQAAQKQKPRPEGEAEAALDSSPRPKRFNQAGELLHFYRFDHHELAHLSLVLELDAARNFGEESIVFAATYV
jgi:hypothetical protein